MFTGIVIDRGRVRRLRRRNGLLELEIEAPRVARQLARGESVSVNGVCLTAIEAGRKRFAAEAMGETLERTTLGNLKKGGTVNLELAARLSDRLGGHLVQGHVDARATVVRIEDEEASRRIWFSAPPAVLRYLVPKGSITLDGVALTVVEAGSSTFSVALIPHTLAETTLGALSAGSEVNVEVDVLAKYVERLMEGKS